MDTACQEHLETVGRLIHARRNSALVFKKNAGKYVGNFNYLHLPDLTIRADLLLLAGLQADWNDVEALLSCASLVRSVNVAVGEKNIPSQIKDQFLEKEPQGMSDNAPLAVIDKWLAQHFAVPVRQLVDASYI